MSVNITYMTQNTGVFSICTGEYSRIDVLRGPLPAFSDAMNPAPGARRNHASTNTTSPWPTP